MNKKGFTLLELLTVVVIIGIIATTALSTVWRAIPEHTLKEDARAIEQFLIKAKSTAIKQSGVVIVDFSAASTNHTPNGGIITMLDIDNNTLDALILNRNVLINSNSTVDGELIFNYQGRPVDSTYSAAGFTESNNTLVFSYYKKTTPLHSKTLTISPLTGNVEF